MEANDMAAMREACQKMRDLLMLRGDGKARCVLTWDEFNESQKMLRAVLAKPPRNCDVGMAKEQEERFEKFCNRFCHDYCRGCPLPPKFWELGIVGECRFTWAQMPYAEGCAS